uniref:Uncharacterized protein n=1 Tax=Plectus sambesii TaxID=2011161 RepID=A0A914XET2_9BILA
MFWTTNMVEAATLSDLLKKDGVTLGEFHTKRLCFILTQPKIIEEIVTNALTPPNANDNVEEKEKFKLSHQSCEVLTINSDEVARTVIGSDFCRKLIGGFFSSAGRLNSLLTSFYTRIITQLLSKFPTE